MRLFVLIGCGLLLAATPSFAAEAPTGEWLVENGHGHVRIENCGGALWGVISWEEQPGQDTENPDPALRGRPTFGMPILIDMKPATVQKLGQVRGALEGSGLQPRERQDVLIQHLAHWALTRCGSRAAFSAASSAVARTGRACRGRRGRRRPAPKAKSAQRLSPKAKLTAKAAPRRRFDVCSRVSDLAGRTH